MLKQKNKMKKTIKRRIKKSIDESSSNKSFYAYITLIGIAVFLFYVIAINPKLTLFAISNPENGNFNLKVEVPTSYDSIEVGKSILFTAKVMNLANQNRVDVTLKYYLLDSGKNIIATKSETVAVETSASFVRELKIPETAKAGTYTLYTQIIYNDNKEAEGENTFRVTRTGDKKIIYTTIIALIVGILVIALLIFLILKSGKIIERIKIQMKIRKIINQKMKKK